MATYTIKTTTFNIRGEVTQIWVQDVSEDDSVKNASRRWTARAARYMDCGLIAFFKLEVVINVGKEGA